MGGTQEGQGRWVLLAETGIKELRDLWGHGGLEKGHGDKVLLEGGARTGFGTTLQDTRTPCRSLARG